MTRATPLVIALTSSLGVGHAVAQDSLPPEQGVRVGITYTPGVRPGMLVLGGPRTPRLDSIRAIIARDLDYSDRYEMITLPQDDSLVLGISAPVGTDGATAASFVNYALYAALGADFAVHVQPPVDSVMQVMIYDVRGEGVRQAVPFPARDLGDRDFRMALHRVSDEVVLATSGTRGVAATRLLLLRHGRVYRIDADGADVGALSSPEIRAFSPAWGARGLRAIYTEFHDGGGRIYLHDIASGERRLIPPTAEALNYTPTASPDGRLLAFSRSGEDGTDIYTYDLAGDCCPRRITVGRFSDNLSPTFSPDGQRIAFVSTRAGAPQIYVMAADGTGQELFAPFDYGVTGSSNAPEWSPDGLHVAFHRDVAGSPQVFVMDVATQTVRQLTSFGRNEDPTWAPDGRHLAFVSSRTGTRQVWVIDLETGRVRQVTRSGDARLPAWSPRID